jgi:hypothetical protein
MAHDEEKADRDRILGYCPGIHAIMHSITPGCSHCLRTGQTAGKVSGSEKFDAPQEEAQWATIPALAKLVRAGRIRDLQRDVERPVL